VIFYNSVLVNKLMFGRKETEQHKIITLGYDVKITPAGKPYIIEINGSRSGLKGIDQLTGEETDEVRKNIRKDLAKRFDLGVREDFFDKKWEDLEEIPRLISLVGPEQSDQLSLPGRQQKFLEKPAEYQMEVLEGVCSKFVKWAYINRKRFLELGKYFSETGYDDPHEAEEVWDMLQRITGITCWYKDDELGTVFHTNIQTRKQLKILREFVKFYFEEKEKSEVAVLKLGEDFLDGKIWFNPAYYVVGEHDLREVSDGKPFVKFRKSLPSNSSKLENLCDDKLTQKKFIPEEFQTYHRVIECPFAPKEFVKHLGKKKPDLSKDLVVVKQIVNGSCGNEVKIINVNDPSKQAVFKSELWPNYNGEPLMMEGFVPSKKIYCNDTHDYHDGCMRYLVDLHVINEGRRLRYEPIFERGYWRLAPIGQNGERVYYSNEQDKDPENWKYRVNLSNKAIAAPALMGDLEIARAAVMESVKLIMRKPKLF
jgi:hypothetical protein